MAQSDISLASQALLRLGAEAITAFDDGTAEADIAAALYPAIRDQMLCAYPWRFATYRRRLARLDADSPGDGAGESEYAAVFQLPAACLRALSLTPPWAPADDADVLAGGGLSYRIRGDRVHCNADAVVMTFIARVDAPAFPAYFAKALVDRLSAEFCLPVMENTARAELLHKLADTSFQIARTADAQSATPMSLNDYTLVRARF